jgi:predicted N-acyltransferase
MESSLLEDIAMQYTEEFIDPKNFLYLEDSQSAKIRLVNGMLDLAQKGEVSSSHISFPKDE